MRSLLFVPADGGKKLDKAMASGADAVIVDLEDSIAPDRKAAARASAADFLKDALNAADRPRLLVRVNGLQTGLTDADLDAVVPARPDAIMLPKAEGGAGDRACRRQARRPRGDQRAARRPHQDRRDRDRDRDLAVSRRHLSRGQRAARGPHLGRRGPLGRARRRGEPRRRRALLRALPAGARALPRRRRRRRRCRRSTPSPPISATWPRCGRETEEARRDGFTGKMAIHPAQVPVINEVFTPTAEAITKARAVVAAFEANPGKGTVGIDGVMYDRPHLERARHAAGARQGDWGGRSHGFSPYTAFGSNVFSPSRNSSVTAPVLPTGTAR